MAAPVIIAAAYGDHAPSFPATRASPLAMPAVRRPAMSDAVESNACAAIAFASASATSRFARPTTSGGRCSHCRPAANDARVAVAATSVVALTSSLPPEGSIRARRSCRRPPRDALQLRDVERAHLRDADVLLPTWARFCMPTSTVAMSSFESAKRSAASARVRTGSSANSNSRACCTRRTKSLRSHQRRVSLSAKIVSSSYAPARIPIASGPRAVTPTACRQQDGRTRRVRDLREQVVRRHDRVELRMPPRRSHPATPSRRGRQ